MNPVILVVYEFDDGYTRNPDHPATTQVSSHSVKRPQ
jgi:hypothetical protein